MYSGLNYFRIFNSLVFSVGVYEAVTLAVIRIPFSRRSSDEGSEIWSTATVTATARPTGRRE